MSIQPSEREIPVDWSTDGIVARRNRFFAASQRRPQWYFPRTSWAALDDDADAATGQWMGGEYQLGERDYAPGYAHLLAGERAPVHAVDSLTTRTP